MPTALARKITVLKSIYGSSRSSLWPATVYAALYTAAPSRPVGTGGTEGGYAAYARAAISNVNASWLFGGDRISNANRINFPTPAADTPSFVSLALHAHITNDDVIHWEDLNYPLSALAGKPLYLPAGEAVITIP